MSTLVLTQFLLFIFVGSTLPELFKFPARSYKYIPLFLLHFYLELLHGHCTELIMLHVFFGINIQMFYTPAILLGKTRVNRCLCPKRYSNVFSSTYQFCLKTYSGYSLKSHDHHVLIMNMFWVVSPNTCFPLRPLNESIISSRATAADRQLYEKMKADAGATPWRITSVKS